MSLTPDVDETHVPISESLKLEGSYVGAYVDILDLFLILGDKHRIICHWV